MPVGYWPEELSGNSRSSIREVTWGGDVYGLINMEPLPAMGSGVTFEQSKRSRGYRYACYIRGIRVQKKLGGHFLDIDGFEVEKKEDLPMCYTVGNPGIISRSWGYTIYAGGYGGPCNW